MKQKKLKHKARINFLTYCAKKHPHLHQLLLTRHFKRDQGHKEYKNEMNQVDKEMVVIQTRNVLLEDIINTTRIQIRVNEENIESLLSMKEDRYCVQ